MSRKIFRALIRVMICLALFSSGNTALKANQKTSPKVDSIHYGVFGKVSLYFPVNEPNSLVLFVSGDGGWNSGVVDMARIFASQGSLVAGIDIRSYYREIRSMAVKCYYPAGDFEELSLMLQRKYKFAEYRKPILAGYSSGATLVYGILVQAPANTFKGAISLGFCPDIEIDKPLCEGSGLKYHVLKEGKSYYLEAAEKLTAPFIALHGFQDQVCPFEATRDYMKKVKDGELIELPKVGHGFSVATSWRPQYIQAFEKILNAPSFEQQEEARDTVLKSAKVPPLAGDFPVVPIPCTYTEKMPMVFLISGDGGWTSFDYSIGAYLAKNGMPVVGLDAQKYFWKVKTPEETVAEVSKAVLYYMQQWNKRSFILAGYSYGACVIPFIATRLPAGLKESLTGLYGLSPDETVDFEVHLTDMIGFGRKADSYRVPQEIGKIRQFQPVCIFGDEEDAKLRIPFSQAGGKIITIPGNHHYNNKPASAAEVIFREVEKNLRN